MTDGYHQIHLFYFKVTHFCSFWARPPAFHFAPSPSNPSRATARWLIELFLSFLVSFQKKSPIFAEN